ncbi:transposase [Aestuariicella hydrocarbonica]|uniref:Transposase n=1 Tax=Pseudomaricurvus hydrocarbonicus TaxID=1470433 RepID=A0A9E5MQA1_9GAMM|nr:transposase [Aestuariicella hydrocarbonica]NHO68518.1 transposase [Aestuariicella hydrocarbonica]
MPRKRRFFIAGVPAHLVQRGHSRQPVFFESQDYATYAHWLKEAAIKYKVAVHAFVLMTNHVHLLVTPTTEAAASQLMQYIGRRYVPYINHKYGKSGTIWEGRFKASLVQDEQYLLTVMRYIELNPVRAGMAELPGHYRWSSFAHNAGLRSISFVSPHPIYMALGEGSASTAATAYTELFRGSIATEDVNRIYESWTTGTPLGSDYFKQRVEAQLGCKVGHARRGRPVKSEKGL